MQDAKDSFYVSLRERLAARNPQRTCVVRGQTRPAVLAEENEMEDVRDVAGVFRLRWVSGWRRAALGLEGAVCEIRFRAADADAPFALDEGRVLGAMDAELSVMLCPARADEMSYAGAVVVTTGGRIFWAEEKPRLTDAKSGERMAVVTVMRYGGA